ncbi:MAG: MFS transporter [Phycisphaeraceae bacterium]|nr:MFS transporter [Phycisphaeraceae bacterium]
MATTSADVDAMSLPIADADETSLHGQLRLITLAWMFGSIWMYTITGAAMTQFSRGLGVTDAGFGILAALPHLAALAQLPASYVLETGGGRRRLFLIFAIASRLMWIVVAGIPLLLRDHPQWWPTTLMAMVFVTWAIGHFSGPAWMSWMADIIPRRVRGRYFATRTRWTQPVGVVTTLLIGYLLDIAERKQAVAPGTMLKVTSGMIAAAGLLGTVDISCFFWVRDPVPQKLLAHDEWWQHLREPLANPSFRRLLGYCFTMMLGIGFLGQYVWLFVLDVVKLSNWEANVYLIGITLLIQVASVKAWGRLMDKLGKKPVMIIAGFLSVLGPVGWFVATAEGWMFGYFLTLISPIAFGGLDLAVFNMLLELSSSNSRAGAEGAQRHGSRGGSAYIAWYSAVAAVGGVLSGLMGGGLADMFKNQIWDAPWGTPLTYHHLLFAVSSSLRFAAVLFVLKLSEPKAMGTRDAIRHISSNIWSNFIDAALLPMRLAGKLSRVSYRVDQPAARRR